MRFLPPSGIWWPKPLERQEIVDHSIEDFASLLRVKLASVARGLIFKGAEQGSQEEIQTEVETIFEFETEAVFLKDEDGLSFEILNNFDPLVGEATKAETAEFLEQVVIFFLHGHQNGGSHNENWELNILPNDIIYLYISQVVLTIY